MKTQNLQQHIENLNDCSTAWIIFKRVDLTQIDKTDYILTQNHCNNRDCPICLKHRLHLARERLIPYFKAMKSVKHVVLTYGKHQELTATSKHDCHRLFNNFMRQLKRRSKYFGLAVFEAKKEPDGLFHLHYHIAFANFSPHHLTVTKRWAKTLGFHADTMTKYTAKKGNMLNYFARRVAMAGMGMTPHEYVTGIYGLRAFTRFGCFYYLEVYGHNSTKNSPESARYFHILLITIAKDQTETIPPPEFNNHDLLEQISADLC